MREKDGAARSSEELALLDALEELKKGPKLPDLAELEPGSFLHLVKEAWASGPGRDGRSGHLTDQEIAELIAQDTGKRFSRNMFQSMFGDARQSRTSRRRQGIPPEVARGYLRVALAHWRRTPGTTGKQFDPIWAAPEDIEPAIDHACAAMFPDFDDELVYCVPSPGPGPRGFYREAGAIGQSVLVASARGPVLITDPSTQIFEWQWIMRSLLMSEAATQRRSIHIWVLREPLIVRDPNHVAALYGLAELQKVLMVARALGQVSNSRQPEEDSDADLWRVISARSCIAIRCHPDNSPNAVPQHHAETELPIYKDTVIPQQLPTRWKTRLDGHTVDELTSIITELDGRYEYHTFAPTPRYAVPPVVHMPSPSPVADSSFNTLYQAGREFLGVDETRKTRGKTAARPHLEAAQRQGWLLLNAEEFLTAEFPLPFPQTGAKP